MEINIDLNELVCENFIDLFIDVVNCEVDRAILKGGRFSGKSQQVSEMIVTGCMTYKASAVAAVKYANKIEERLVNTFNDTIRYLGVESFWKLRRSPFEYVLLDEFGKETDISIKFTGCDNPENLKSFKPRRGSFRYIWFEELTNFPSLKEVNSLIQTFARGEGKHTIIKTYNPPMSASHWVNKEYNVPVGKALGYESNYYYSEFEFEIYDGIKEKTRQVIHHSTYLDIIEDSRAHWLGTTVIGEAKQSKEENTKYYRWAYLGEIIGTDANVFWNIHDWDGNTDGLVITEILRGLDWGLGGPDPCAYVEWYYDRKNRRLYALNEFYKTKMVEEEVALRIKELNKYNGVVTADSSVPIINNRLTNLGINVVPAIKGGGSVMEGVLWLQGLNGLYINKNRTPNIYREFTGYEYKLDKEDNITSKLSEDNNHTIDATRYSAENEIRYE